MGGSERALGEQTEAAREQTIRDWEVVKRE